MATNINIKNKLKDQADTIGMGLKEGEMNKRDILEMTIEKVDGWGMHVQWQPTHMRTQSKNRPKMILKGPE